MITLAQYYMGRDVAYASELTEEKKNNAAITVSRLNLLSATYEAAGIKSHVHPVNQSQLSSGWRPVKVNASTPKAAVNSLHMVCKAGDIYDPDGDIDEWALANPQVLVEIGLWQEHPASTKGWAHFQTVPPRSGNRVFYP